MRQQFDMVIIDTPPYAPDAGRARLRTAADGVILVVRSARTAKETVATAGQRLAEDERGSLERC